MKKSLLISAAALLIAGPAFAQGMQNQGGSHQGGAQMPERAPAAQQSAPAEKSAPPATTGQAEPKAEPKAMPRDSQVAPGSSRAPDSKAGQEVKPGTTGQGSSDKASQSEKASPGNNAQAPGSNTPARDAGKSQTTTGQGAASTSASLTTEQRTKISASLKQSNAPRVTKVNFSITIGTQVPRDIRRAPLPAAVIEVYPVWRGYEYVMVEDEILIIDPATMRIVAVIEA
jgi:hypothetical protein